MNVKFRIIGIQAGFIKIQRAIRTMAFAKQGPLIPPPSAKPGPLIPPPSAKPKSQTRKRNNSNKKTTRSKCTGSRKTCRRRELRRRASEKSRRQAKAAEKIAASATSQSVEEASDSSYLSTGSTNSGYNEYKEYMAQGKLKDEELGELHEEIKELELAGAYEEAVMKRKNLQGIIGKITAMNQQFKRNDEPIMEISKP